MIESKTSIAEKFQTSRYQVTTNSQFCQGFEEY